MKKLTMFLIAVMTCLGLYAQDVKVTGKVVSSTDGEPPDRGNSDGEGFLIGNRYRH